MRTPSGAPTADKFRDGSDLVHGGGFKVHQRLPGTTIKQQLKPKNVLKRHKTVGKDAGAAPWW